MSRLRSKTASGCARSSAFESVVGVEAAREAEELAVEDGQDLRHRKVIVGASVPA